MEMLRRNLKRQTSRSLSPLFVVSPADDQENLHPNLAAASPSPANKPSTSGLSKPVSSAAAAAVPQPAPPQQQHALAPVHDEPSVKVVVRVRPAVSLPVDGKDILFMRKTSSDSIAVGDRAFAIDGFPTGLPRRMRSIW